MSNAVFFNWHALSFFGGLLFVLGPILLYEGRCRIIHDAKSNVRDVDTRKKFDDHIMELKFLREFSSDAGTYADKNSTQLDQRLVYITLGAISGLITVRLNVDANHITFFLALFSYCISMISLVTTHIFCHKHISIQLESDSVDAMIAVRYKNNPKFSKIPDKLNTIQKEKSRRMRIWKTVTDAVALLSFALFSIGVFYSIIYLLIVL